MPMILWIKMLWIYYQSNLTKRLIMNSDLILNNEYKYLDNLKEFPNIQKLYLMLLITA